jgi:hypothetical protein
MYLKELRYDVDLSGSGQGSVVGSYEHGNEPLIPQKMGNFSTS